MGAEKRVASSEWQVSVGAEFRFFLRFEWRISGGNADELSLHEAI